MNRFLVTSVISLLLFSETAIGCTVTIVGLRKQFRNSSQIFVGEFLSFEDLPPDGLPRKLVENWETLGRARFKVENSWKGPESGETLLYVNPFCVCPMRQFFPKPGDKLLVFADNDAVVDACDLYLIEMKNERKKEDVERITKSLNSFWFRTWARLYSF